VRLHNAARRRVGDSKRWRTVGEKQGGERHGITY
jgi:hypothetical protein